VVTVFQDAPGSTPLDPDEAAGLLPKHITSQADLNAWEQNNILQGREWAQQTRQRKRDFLNEGFIRELHQRMFGDTWKWAGTFRSSDKTIGVAWEQIAVQLRDLLDNIQHQKDNNIYAADELAIRFHHRLVWIHPFPNGNGRHSRLMAELLVTQLGGLAFSWGGGADLVSTGAARERYLNALREADAGAVDSLITFARD